RLGLEPREHLEPPRRKLVRADGVDDLGQVAQAPLVVNHAGLLVARLSVAAQLHMVIPPSMEWALPVAKSDSSDARDTTMPVVSSTVPSRPLLRRATTALRAWTGPGCRLRRPWSDCG